jgi:hypothetical protein
MATAAKGRRVYTAAIALAVALSTPITAASAASSALASIRIDNFGVVTDVYYRGAQPEGGDRVALAGVVQLRFGRVGGGTSTRGAATVA